MRGVARVDYHTGPYLGENNVINKVSLRIFCAGLAAASSLLTAMPVHARGVSPYLPVNLAPEIERDIARVLILGNQAVLTRPIATARVLDALPIACEREPRLCQRVRRFLERYMRGSGLAHASIEVSTGADVVNVLPNRHGLTTDSNWNVATQGYASLGDYLLVSGGVVAYDGDATPTGSMVSLGFEYAQLDVGYRDRWLSPMSDSSLLLSTEAVTMPSITLSNYTPITSLGVRYEFFLAEMSHTERIAYQGGYTTGKPRLGGLHLSLEPAAGWALGGNRILQFGGGARGGRGFGDFMNAFFKPHSYDNTSATLNNDQEFGNQLAAWTSRMVFNGRVPMAVYFEYGGEDSSFAGNYRVGNAALSAGIDLPSLGDNFDLTYEFSEWQNAWYAHSVYGDGLTNEGRILGHWFGDARVQNDAVGGQSHMLRLGWRPDFGGIAELKYRTLANEHYTGYDYQRAHDISLRYSYPWRSVLIGGEVNAGRDVFGETYSRIAAFARLGADYSFGNRSRELDNIEDSVEYFVDAGGSVVKMRIEIADGRPVEMTGLSFAPHVGVGARRAVSDRSDLGARLELDQVDGELLLAVRALDYRYRWGRHFAMTGFLGAARYDLATPAFGYYIGAGAQWRGIADNWDLNFDLRFGDKIARDKVLPTDPAPAPRPDMFYDFYGLGLYLSYRL